MNKPPVSRTHLVHIRSTHFLMRLCRILDLQKFLLTLFEMILDKLYLRLQFVYLPRYLFLLRYFCLGMKQQLKERQNQLMRLMTQKMVK